MKFYITVPLFILIEYQSYNLTIFYFMVNKRNIHEDSLINYVIPQKEKRVKIKIKNRLLTLSLLYNYHEKIVNKTMFVSTYLKIYTDRSSNYRLVKFVSVIVTEETRIPLRKNGNDKTKKLCPTSSTRSIVKSTG